MEPSIPKDLLHFITTCIDRLETLDVLMLLQSTRGRSWTAPQLSDEMRSSPLAAESALGLLVTKGLVVRKGDAYEFSPATSEMEVLTVRLAACYREKRTAVISAIFSRPSDSVRSFAEAFRLKRGGSDG